MKCSRDYGEIRRSWSKKEREWDLRFGRAIIIKTEVEACVKWYNKRGGVAFDTAKAYKLSRMKEWKLFPKNIGGKLLITKSSNVLPYQKYHAKFI